MTDDTSASALRPAEGARPSPPSWPWSNAIAKANNIIWRLCKGVSPQQIYDALDAEGLRIIEKEHDNSPDVLASLPAGGAGDEGEAKPVAWREQAARIIDPEAYEALDELAREASETLPSVHRYLHRIYDPRIEAALKKVDAVSALASPAPVKPSAPAFNCSHKSGESDPAVTQDCAGADTRAGEKAPANLPEQLRHVATWVESGIEQMDWTYDAKRSAELLFLAADEIAALRAVEKAGEPTPLSLKDMLKTADDLIGIQEDLPDDQDRDVLGRAAHYLRKYGPPTATPSGADGPVTTEQLDKLQFGRVLHERPSGADVRPAEPGRGPATIEACAKFIESGSGMADLIDYELLDEQAKLIRALSPQREGGR